jgi:hypothetical protein
MSDTYGIGNARSQIRVPQISIFPSLFLFFISPASCLADLGFHFQYDDPGSYFYALFIIFIFVLNIGAALFALFIVYACTRGALSWISGFFAQPDSLADRDLVSAGDRRITFQHVFVLGLLAAAVFSLLLVQSR